MAAGEALEEGLVEGLPHDELYLYEDALRKGRSVVIAFVETDETEEAARNISGERGSGEHRRCARKLVAWHCEMPKKPHYQTSGRKLRN